MDPVEIQLDLLSKEKVPNYTVLLLTSIDQLIGTEKIQIKEALFDDLKLVVWELLCNIVEHRGVSPKTTLYVRISCSMHKLNISFHPYSQTEFCLYSQIEKQQVDFSEPRGRGLFIIRQLCELSYDAKVDTITVVFRYRHYQGA